MKITKVEIFDIECPERPPWNPVFVRIYTDEGITVLVKPVWLTTGDIRLLRT